jgi:hypothetical protein
MKKLTLPILLMLSLILNGCTAVRTESSNIDDSNSWDSNYSEEVTVLTEPPGAIFLYHGEYVGTSPTTFKTCLFEFTVHQSGTYEEPYARITGGYKVEVFKEGYLPQKITVYIKENDQTFKEAFRNGKQARYGRQTSYIGNRELNISLTPSPRKI